MKENEEEISPVEHIRMAMANKADAIVLAAPGHEMPRKTQARFAELGKDEQARIIEEAHEEALRDNRSHRIAASHPNIAKHMKTASHKNEGRS